MVDPLLLLLILQLSLKTGAPTHTHSMLVASVCPPGAPLGLWPLRPNSWKELQDSSFSKPLHKGCSRWQTTCLAAAFGISTKTARDMARRWSKSGRSLHVAAKVASAKVQKPFGSDDFLDFVGRTGSPAHTVAEAKRRLVDAGFIELPDGPWDLKPGGKYFATGQLNPRYPSFALCCFWDVSHNIYIYIQM